MRRMTANESSEQGQQRRRDSVRNALASSRLSGGSPTPETVSNLDAYVRGQVTIDELVDGVIKRQRQT